MSLAGLNDTTAFYERLQRDSLEVELRRKTDEIAGGGLLEHVFREAEGSCGKEIGVALEFGGGYGTNLMLLSKRVKIKRCISYDLIVPRAKLPGVEYIAGSWEALLEKTPISSVDLILAIETIEHVFSPDAMVEVCKRILKPGAVLIVTTPNLSSAVSRLSLLLGWQPPDTEVSTKTKFGYPGSNVGRVVGHLRVFTFRSLIEFLAYHGLIVERAFTVPRGLSVKSGEGPSLLNRSYARIDHLATRFSRRLGSRTIVVCRTSRTAQESW